MKRAKGSCLKLRLRNGNIHRYDGFKETDLEKLKKFVKSNLNLELEEIELAVKGWNWGSTSFVGNSLVFDVDGKPAFEIPLTDVSQCVNNKNEVTVEFHQNDDAAVSLVEMRFHVPSKEGDASSAAEAFQEKVLAQADVIQALGDAICSFDEISCLTPRGRYNMRFYTSFIDLHGKTFDYKISFSTIVRLFLLPHKDDRQFFLVISLDPPIKQGQTRYPFLILLFSRDEEINLEVTLTDQVLKERYEGKLQREMSGPTYEVMSRVLKALAGKKITVPGNFVGHSGSHCVSCSYKAAAGLLYPLDRCFLYVHKPPVCLRFEEINWVHFARSSGSTRSFDFEVEAKNGTVYTFSSIEKDEYQKLYDFVAEKNLRIQNIGKKASESAKAAADDSDEEEEHDAYLERVKAEGRERDDTDDDDDEDFVADESGSDVKEEFDSNASSSSGEDEDGDVGEKKKEKKIKKEAKEVKEKGDASGDEDKSAEESDDASESEEEKKKEKKKPPKSKSAKTVPEPGTKRKRETKKKDRDPDMPKRGQTAYFLWMGENRERIKKENPGISVTEIGRKSGEQWRNLKDKSKWEQEAQVQKKEYERKMAEYKSKQKDKPKELPAAKKSSPVKKKDSPAKKKTNAAAASTTSKSGSGSQFKSKEYVSSSEDDDDGDGDDDDDDEDELPLKKSKKDSTPPKKEAKKEPKKEAKKEPKKAVKEPKKEAKKVTRSKKKSSDDEDEMDDELPSDEDILSSPTASSEEEDSASGSESD